MKYLGMKDVTTPQNPGTPKQQLRTIRQMAAGVVKGEGHSITPSHGKANTIYYYNNINVTTVNNYRENMTTTETYSPDSNLAANTTNGFARLQGKMPPTALAPHLASRIKKKSIVAPGTPISKGTFYNPV